MENIWDRLLRIRPKSVYLWFVVPIQWESMSLAQIREFRKLPWLHRSYRSKNGNIVLPGFLSVILPRFLAKCISWPRSFTYDPFRSTSIKGSCGTHSFDFGVRRYIFSYTFNSALLGFFCSDSRILHTPAYSPWRVCSRYPLSPFTCYLLSTIRPPRTIRGIVFPIPQSSNT